MPSEPSALAEVAGGPVGSFEDVGVSPLGSTVSGMIRVLCWGSGFGVRAFARSTLRFLHCLDIGKEPPYQCSGHASCEDRDLKPRKMWKPSPDSNLQVPEPQNLKPGSPHTRLGFGSLYGNWFWDAPV